MTKIDKKTLVLLDVHAIIHRAYHALPDFSSAKGEPTGALYGLMLMLLKIIEEFKPDHIAACFDLPKPTYRHEAYVGYKAGRKKADEALIAQIIRCRDIFKALSIPMYDKEGFEADDMLGTIVEKLKDRKDLTIIIASGDMDTMQLVDNDRVKVFTLRKGVKDTVTYGEKEVIERFGFEPKYLPDYKGLRGDPSDNIIGIKGIGEKTATSLIQTFGTVEKMYKAIDKDEQEKFKKIGVSDRIFELLKDNKEEAMFSKMLATIRRDAPIEFEINGNNWKEGVDVKKLSALMSELEFRSLIPRVEKLFSKAGEMVSLEADKDKTEIPNKLTSLQADKLKIAVWLLDSSITNPQISDVEALSNSEIEKQIKERGLEYVYEDIEIPLIPILKKMHDVGVMIDVDYLKKLSKEYHKNLDSIDKQIFKLAGREFNVDSPKQLGEVLFGDLKLVGKNMKKTAGGAQSTKESELEKLRDAHPIIPLVLEHRELAKLLGTYVDLIPTYVKEDGRIHPTFIQTGAATGRMASTEPAVQNIPIKSELGRAIRHAFIAEKGYELCAFDYSQIELRIAAILSGDEKLIKIFKDGEDVHTAVASQVFKVPIDKVDKEMRRKAKVINFGILYGMGVNALKANLGSTREEAQKFYKDYFETFSTLAAYLEEVKKTAARDGYTITLYGRRRYFEGIKSHLPFIRAAAERMAINAPMQGTQSDIMKLAMIEIDKMIEKEKLGDDVRLLLQIHDELIYEIKDKLVEEISPRIKKIMESILPKEKSKGVPITANASCGNNWGEMASIENSKS